MAVCILFWIGLGWWAIAMLVQWVSAALALRRRAGATVAAQGGRFQHRGTHGRRP